MNIYDALLGAIGIALALMGVAFYISTAAGLLVGLIAIGLVGHALFIAAPVKSAPLAND